MPVIPLGGRATAAIVRSISNWALRSASRGKEREYVESSRFGSGDCRSYGGLVPADLAGQDARSGCRFSSIGLQLGSVQYLARTGADDREASYISFSARL